MFLKLDNSRNTVRVQINWTHDFLTETTCNHLFKRDSPRSRFDARYILCRIVHSGIFGVLPRTLTVPSRIITRSLPSNGPERLLNIKCSIPSRNQVHLMLVCVISIRTSCIPCMMSESNRLRDSSDEELARIRHSGKGTCSSS